jgi:drug/metabolite transporter (DMT)-like permease
VNPADPAIADKPVGSPTRNGYGRPRVAGLWNGATRALLVVFGGLLILQSSDRLDAAKLGYLVVAGVASAGSVAEVWRARTQTQAIAMRPWLVASVVILGSVVLSLPVALLHGSTTNNWVRDAAAYVLLGVAPWLAVDLARAASMRLIFGAGLLAGLLGVASFVLEWVQRRHLIDLPIDRLTLPSMSLGAVAYCLAIAFAVRSRGRSRAAWIFLSMAILVAFLLTGTRTAFVLLAAPAAVVVVDSWQRGWAGLRAAAAPVSAQVVAIGLVLLVSLGGLSLVPVAGPSADPTGAAPGTAGPVPPDLEDRYSTLDDIASGRDQSLRLRIEQTRVAWQVFMSSPLLGVGLGHEFTWKISATTERRALTLDTPMVVFAKFGLLSLLLAGALVAAYWLVVRAMIRRGGPDWRALSLVGYGAVLVALIPFGWPPEDKGTGFALVFLLALAAVPWSTSAETAV